MIWGIGANAPFEVRHVDAETFVTYRTMAFLERFSAKFGQICSDFSQFGWNWTKLDLKLDFLLAFTNVDIKPFFN